MEPKTIQEILECLKAVDPYKVILFGSSVSGKPRADSDIDLLVVTKHEFIPKDFKQKNQIYLQVAKSLRTIEERIPIDLIVHTKGMHKRFMELGSMFSKEIVDYGKVIYEENN